MPGRDGATRRLRRLTGAALTVALLPFPASGESAYLIDELLIGIHAERALDSAIIHVVPTGTRLEVHERDEEFARVTTEDGTTGWVDASYLTDAKPARLRLAELEAEKTRLADALVAAESRIDALRQQLEQAVQASLPAPGDRPEPAEVAALRTEYEKRVAALEAEIERAEASRSAVEQQYTLRNLAATRDAEAEIEALKGELAKLRRGGSTGSGAAADPSSGEGGMAELEAENRRLAAALEERGGPPRAGVWRLGSVTVWQLAAAAFCLLLAFSLGALWIDFRARRRHGGFRI